jgi:hypothetical protein
MLTEIYGISNSTPDILLFTPFEQPNNCQITAKIEVLPWSMGYFLAIIYPIITLYISIYYHS